MGASAPVAAPVVGGGGGSMAARGDTPALGDVAPAAAGVDGATKATSAVEAALVPYECCIWRKEAVPRSLR